MAELYNDSSEHLSRRQLSRNLVLMKSNIGKSAPSSYILPHERHAYGKGNPSEVESARDVSTIWTEHVPSPRRSVNCQNFLRVNCMAAKNNIGNAKDLAKFRKQCDYPADPPKPDGGPQPLLYPSDLSQTFTYGQKTRPATPIKMVIANSYGAGCEDDINLRYLRYATQRADNDRPLTVRMTRSCRAKISSARGKRHAETAANNRNLLPGQHDLWVMSRFKDIPSHFEQDKSTAAEAGLPAVLPENKDAVLDLRKPRSRAM